MAQVKIVEVSNLKAGGNQDIDWPSFGLWLLAQGDSWFSIGALPPMQTTSILTGIQKIGLNQRAVIINAARPGKQLERMMDTTTDSEFVEALRGSQERQWDGILFSGGGNDLIEGVQADPGAKPGERLLQQRATPSDDPAAYVSEEGWNQLAVHMRHYYDGLLENRAQSKYNHQTPLLLHNYATLQPRNVGTVGLGPWLYPALVRYGVPPALFMPLSRLLMGRIADVLQQFAQDNAQANVVLVDSLNLAGLEPAEPRSQPGKDVASGDFLNEIHPTTAGYVKLAKVWQPALNQL